MKRKLAMLILALTLLAGCAGAEKPVQIPGLDLSQARALAHSDSQGGFHGDGTVFRSYQFPQPPQFGPDWRELPMEETVMVLCYGVSTDSGSRGPYLPEGLIPAVEEGYYFFLDRHPQRETAPDVLSRSSFNFTVAVYDSGTNVLYYVEQDT